MRPPEQVAAGLLALATLLLAVLFAGRATEDGGMLVHCAAGLFAPVSEAAKEFEAETGVAVRLNVGGSGTLEAQISLMGGDLFIPADSSYIERTMANGIVEHASTVAEVRACIVVARGNPLAIRGLEDLPAVRLSVAEPSAAVGKFVREVLEDSGDWAALMEAIAVTKPTVNQVLEDVAIGAVDAGLVWDAVALGYDEVDVVRELVFEAKPRRVEVGLIVGAGEGTRAFQEFLVGDRGREIFRRCGFGVLEN